MHLITLIYPSRRPSSPLTDGSGTWMSSTNTGTTESVSVSGTLAIRLLTSAVMTTNHTIWHMHSDTWIHAAQTQLMTDTLQTAADLSCATPLACLITLCKYRVCRAFVHMFSGIRLFSVLHLSSRVVPSPQLDLKPDFHGKKQTFFFSLKPGNLNQRLYCDFKGSIIGTLMFEAPLLEPWANSGFLKRLQGVTSVWPCGLTAFYNCQRVCAIEGSA